MDDQERIDQLKKAGEFDIAPVDEAHFARRQGSRAGLDEEPSFGKLYKALYEGLRKKAGSMWLATATPMQLNAVEAYDLADLIGRLGCFASEQSLVGIYYTLLGNLARGLSPTSEEQETLHIIVRRTQFEDPALWERISSWQDGFDQHWRGDQNEAIREEFRAFKRQVLENFKYYRVPVISLDRSTSKEAVCVVFEKVNTGGKPLDAFELVTAMYAASGHELRKDWYGDDGTKGRHRRLAEALRPAGAETGILAGVANTDFLQAISLFYTRDRRRSAEAAGKQGKELPAVSGNRQALLNLPLEEYKRFEVQVERGFVQAAKFLHMLHIYRIFDLPYQSQIVPLAAILADIGDAWEHEANRAKLIRWYWNGVFGELYGSAVETRIARDFMEVPVWLNGGPEPSRSKPN